MASPDAPSAVPPDVAPLLEQQLAIYQDALDHLDHAGLSAFLSLEQQQREDFLEETNAITAEQAARH